MLLLALKDLLPDQIPAQGQGTMNNLAIGWEKKTYYETIAGGMGGNPKCDGASAVQIHMTNTATTPVETLESAYPIRVIKTSLRDGSERVFIRAGWVLHGNFFFWRMQSYPFNLKGDAFHQRE